MKKIIAVVILCAVIAVLGILGVLYFREQKPGEVSVHHEWGALEEAIVGRGEDIILPSWSEQIEKLDADPGLKKLWKENEGRRYIDLDPEGAKKIIEQINGLAKVLEKRGVVVYRNNRFTPEDIKYLINVQLGGSLLFSRDPILVINDNIIETALQAPLRRKEVFTIRPVLLDAAKYGGAKYISMPVASPRMPREKETDPFLEGGDVLLNGYEIYVGLSGRASNLAGVEWLRRYLGPKYQVRVIELRPDILHLDCALALLGPDLGLICRERIKSKLPDSLKDFDFVEVTEEEAKKLGTNVLVLDEKTVIVDEQHKRIAEELREKGREVITIPYDAVSLWGGAFRCSHHPLRRKSSLTAK